MDIELLAKRIDCLASKHRRLKYLGGLVILTMCTGLIMGLTSCVNTQQRRAEREAGRVRLDKLFEVRKALLRKEERLNLKRERLHRERCCQSAVEAKDRCDEYMERANSEQAFEEYAAMHDLIHRMCSLEGEWNSIAKTFSWQPEYKASSDKVIELEGRRLVLGRLYINYFKRKIKLLDAKASQDKG